MNTDPISDYLTRIRNASRAKHSKVVIPYSKLKEEITKVLQKRKFLGAYEVKENGKFKELVVEIKPWSMEPLTLTRVSRPGQRIYMNYKDIKAVKNGLGVLILSTSKGLMPGEEARDKKMGGEAICKVY
jgi:small subunit ribosomal protein S8